MRCLPDASSLAGPCMTHAPGVPAAAFHDQQTASPCAHRGRARGRCRCAHDRCRRCWCLPCHRCHCRSRWHARRLMSRLHYCAAVIAALLLPKVSLAAESRSPDRHCCLRLGPRLAAATAAAHCGALVALPLQAMPVTGGSLNYTRSSHEACKRPALEFDTCTEPVRYRGQSGTVSAQDRRT